jgi:cytochrome b pre-mRNA-processing protein 3
MILRFFRKDRGPTAVEAVFGRIVDASREPHLYSNLGIPDTVEGRFESAILHMVVTLRRLRELPKPADEFAQELVDAFFQWLDDTLRDMGVGDIAVPKRMKKLVEAFYGRAHSYDSALDQQDRAALVATLRRNVTGEEPAEMLADYLVASCARMAEQDFEALVATGPAFAPPEEPAAAPSET